MARADQIYLGVVLTNTDTTPTGLVAGDLVELDINSAASVKRVGTGGSSKVIGVVVTGGAQNSKVVVGGFPGQRLNVNVSTSLAAEIGDKVISSAIAGLATIDNGAPTDQVLGTVLSPKVGGVGNTIDVLFTTIASAGGGAAAGDGQVLTDGSDTTAGFLTDKLAAGVGITLTVQNVGGNETILIEADEDAPHDATYLVKTVGASGLTNAIAADTLGGPGFLKADANGNFSIDTSTYQIALTNASGANLAGKFILQGTSASGLPNAQFLGALSTGVVKNTTTTGVLSVAVSNTDYAAPDAYYVVVRSTNAPTNATNLGALASGFIKSTVAGGISTLSVDASTYLTTASAAATYALLLSLTNKSVLFSGGGSTVAEDNANFSYDSVTKVLTLGGQPSFLSSTQWTNSNAAVSAAGTASIRAHTNKLQYSENGGTWTNITDITGADSLGYYVVTQSTNAPTNAINLGALTTGLVKSTVSGGVSTLSIDANTYLSTSVAAATYQPILTAGTNITIVGTTISATSFADANAYYVTTRSTNAPTNAANLGALTTGLVKSTVSGGVATLSIDASTYLTTSVAAATYQVQLTSTSGSDLTSKFILQGTADSGTPNAQFLGSLTTGVVKNTTTTGVLSIAVPNTDYAAPDAYYLVSQSTGAPSNAINLGALTTGVLQQSVTSAVATPSVLAVATGAIPYGDGTGKLTASAANTDGAFWESGRLNIYRSNATTASALRLINPTVGSQGVFVQVMTGPGVGGTTAEVQMFLSKTSISFNGLSNTPFISLGNSAKTLILGITSTGDVALGDEAHDVINSASGGWAWIPRTGTGPWISTPASVATLPHSAPIGIYTGAGGYLMSYYNSAWHSIQFDVPPGITQLTGDGTAGPGSGSQAFTLTNTAVTAGSYTVANFTVDAKGRLTAASGLAVAAGVIPFGAPTGGTLTQQTTPGTSSGLQWDTTNERLVITRNATGTGTALRLANPNAGATGASIEFFALGLIQAQVQGTSLGLVINVNQGQPFIVNGSGSPGQFIYARTDVKDVVIGDGGKSGATPMSVAATAGWLWLPFMNGVPTGVPANAAVTQFNTSHPIVIDNAHSRLYSYIGGAWHYTAFDDGTGAANPNAYYVVTQSTNAPTNAINLGSLSTGLVKSTVSSGVSTLSIDTTAYLNGSVGPGAGTYGGAGFMVQDVSLDVNGRVTALTVVATASAGADSLGYYVVTRSTNAPTNALNLGGLSSGFVKITVSGGIASVSSDTNTYLTTASAASTYQPILTAASSANLTPKFILQGTTQTGTPNAQFLGALATGVVKNTTTTGVLSVAVSNTDYAAPDAYYVTTRSTNTPTNSTNLGALTTGLVKSTVSGGVSTLSIDANVYLTTTVAAATYQPILTAGSNITIVGNTISATSSGGGADPNAYYIVTRSTNAPTNALNLGALTTGLVKSTVSGGIASISIDSTTYLTGTLTNTDVLFATGAGTIGQDSNFTWNSTTHVLTTASHVISAASGSLVFSASGAAEIQKTNGNLSIGTMDSVSTFTVFTNHTSRFAIDNAGTAFFAGNVLPSLDSTYNLGGAANQWAQIYAAAVNGNSGSHILTLSNQSGGTIQVVLSGFEIQLFGTVSSSGTIYPAVDNTYNLGDTTHRWANVYIENLDVAGSIGTNGSFTVYSFSGALTLSAGTTLSLTGSNADITTGGSVSIAAGSSGNIFLFADRSTNARSAQGCLYLEGAIVNPASNPTTGVFIYVSGGGLFARTPHGVTQLAA